MEIDPKQVKALREKTGAGMMDCKRALQEAKGDLAEAEKILRKKGIAVAGKKAGRAANEGCIASYIHHGSKLGVLVEVNSETDFVARNDSFREFVKDITQHIAATNPSYIRREDVPAGLVESEKEIYRAQVKDKPAPAVEKIITGKLEKFYSTVCLLEQPFVKNGEITVNDHLTAVIAQLGENIVIRRFIRWQLGEEVGGTKPAA
jgi:elongation factor Ts